VNAGAFDAYDLVFALAADGGSGTAESFTGVTSLTVSLNPGKYDLTFTAKKGSVTAAEGTVQNITVSGGQTVNVTVPLVFRPEAGTGTLSFSITRPSGFDLSGAGFTLTPLHEGGTSYGTTWLNALYSGEKKVNHSGDESVASGYYRAIVTLSTRERKAVKDDIVHIGAGQITTLEWIFEEDDFATIVDYIRFVGNPQWGEGVPDMVGGTENPDGTYTWVVNATANATFCFILDDTSSSDSDKWWARWFHPETDETDISTPGSYKMQFSEGKPNMAWKLSAAGHYTLTVDPYAKTVTVTKPVTVTGVIVKDANGDTTTTAISLPQGTVDYQFSAEVQGTNAEGTGVSWAISSGTVTDGTAIGTDGKLTIAETETSGNTFTVTATSTADPAKSGSVEISTTAKQVGATAAITLKALEGWDGTLGVSEGSTSIARSNGSLVISVRESDFTSFIWIVDGTNLEGQTDSSITLSGRDYGLGGHSVTVYAMKEKDGVPWSSTDPIKFIVTAQ
jgi:hypothetical protein